MSTLTYRDLDVWELAVGECTVRRRCDEHGVHLSLVARVLRSDNGQPLTIGAPIAPGCGYTETPRRTWGFGRTAPGIWQVSPSINARGYALDADGKPTGAEISIWHETPAVIGVPEPPWWEQP